ncbi:MAG: hypothetical protein QOJ13_1146 [Gaiellales bacterium]|jgi:hypothetical protein|nr:hypothetical protein [Gaiellales bacterium]
MTAPLVWLLLTALGIIAPTAPSIEPWEGKPLLVVTRPQQPVTGSPVTVIVAAVPKSAGKVNVVADETIVRAQRRPSGVWQATIVAPAAGPLSLRVRFTLNGTRYEAQGGIVLVAPAASGG